MSTAAPPPLAQDARILSLIGTGHFLSHFYMLALPPLFPIWRDAFDASYWTIGLSFALMSAVTGALQTPVGFLVDKHGARPYLVGGVLLMALSIAGMAFAPNFWVILLLSVLSGVGNSVIHPADYAILGGSIHQSRIGRAFAMHTFTGNLGFAAAPPAMLLMLGVMDWRMVLLVIGLAGVPVVLAILWQSRILQDQAKPKDRKAGPTGRELLLSRPILLFFAFFLLSSMAGSMIQTATIPVLHELWGVTLSFATMALTGYMVGATSGVLVGGWYADRYQRQATFVIALTVFSAAMMLLLGVLPLPGLLLPLVAGLGGVALGASRTPRDVMLKEAIPPGQMGKVFGFVSSGLPLGGAVAPVPTLWLIDLGLAWLVMPLVAVVMLASLLCMGSARGAALADRARRGAAVPAE